MNHTERKAYERAIRSQAFIPPARMPDPDEWTITVPNSADAVRELFQ